MASALRRLGVFLFCLGGIAVVVGLVPVGLALAGDVQREQTWLAVAVVGGLLVVCGLVMDFLGSQAVRESLQQQASVAMRPTADDPRPPTMKLSSAPKGGKGYREDLMA
jgi:Na+/melibiose symporter-like transporter